MMISRPRYINRLLAYKDKDLIKVLTGLRRVGKSTILEMFKSRLIEDGVSPDQIIFLNFERPGNDALRDPSALYQYILKKASLDKPLYVFLDEIQHVENFEHAIDGLFTHKNIDIYLTGSNAFFLSGELATLLSGRYLEIEVLPLSFSEFVSAKADNSVTLASLYAEYVTFGGLPYVLEMNDDDFSIFDYLGGVYNTVVRKDVARRKGSADTLMLDAIVKFLIDSMGSPISIKKIADTLTSGGRKVSNHTVSDYVQALLDAFVFYRANRYDLKGKQHLRTQEKYYVTDLGFKLYLLGKQSGNVGHLLESIIYLELRRRFTHVQVGFIDGLEVDFVATGASGTEYYQVSASVLDSTTLERELRPLKVIDDNYPKHLLTFDEIGLGDHDGILQENALKWLLAVPE